MSLLTILVVFAAVAIALWLLHLASKLEGVEAWWVRIAQTLVLVIVVVYLCRLLGVFALLSSVRI